MQEQYLWPLVGVALGWFLSLFAATIKDRIEDRRKLGRLVSKLMVVHDQLDTLMVVTEKIKEKVDGWESYERMRKGITERHFLNPRRTLTPSELRLTIWPSCFPSKLYTYTE